MENINKRIRRYMPGDTDLAGVSQRKLIQLARHLNDQPRKSLDYRTPAYRLEYQFRASVLSRLSTKC